MCPLVPLSADPSGHEGSVLVGGGRRAPVPGRGGAGAVRSARKAVCRQRPRQPKPSFFVIPCTFFLQRQPVQLKVRLFGVHSPRQWTQPNGEPGDGWPVARGCGPAAPGWPLPWGPGQPARHPALQPLLRGRWRRSCPVWLHGSLDLSRDRTLRAQEHGGGRILVPGRTPGLVTRSGWTAWVSTCPPLRLRPPL